jgi:ubiquinone biosynthesis protein UbiJ
MTRSEAYAAQRQVDALRRDQTLLTDRVDRLEQQVRSARRY